MRGALVAKGKAHTNAKTTHRTQSFQLRPNDIHLGRIGISDRYRDGITTLSVCTTSAGTKVHCAVGHTIDLDFLSNLIVMTHKVDTFNDSRGTSYIELYTQICLLGSDFRSNILNVNNVKSLLKTLITFTMRSQINGNRIIFASNVFISGICLSDRQLEEIIVYLIDKIQTIGIKTTNSTRLRTTIVDTVASEQTMLREVNLVIINEYSGSEQSMLITSTSITEVSASSFTLEV